MSRLGGRRAYLVAQFVALALPGGPAGDAARGRGPEEGAAVVAFGLLGVDAGTAAALVGLSGTALASAGAPLWFRVRRDAAE